MCELGGGCYDSCESGCNEVSMLCKKRDWSHSEGSEMGWNQRISEEAKRVEIHM